MESKQEREALPGLLVSRAESIFDHTRKNKAPHARPFPVARLFFQGLVFFTAILIPFATQAIASDSAMTQSEAMSQLEDRISGMDSLSTEDGSLEEVESTYAEALNAIGRLQTLVNEEEGTIQSEEIKVDRTIRENGTRREVQKKLDDLNGRLSFSGKGGAEATTVADAERALAEAIAKLASGTGEGPGPKDCAP